MASLLHRRLLPTPPRSESKPIHVSLIVGFAAGALSAALACLLCLFIHQCILRMRRRPQPPPPAPERAADPFGIPVSLYDSSSGTPKGETSCTVCLADYADGEEVRVLPRCGHAFHRECIDRWLVKGPQQVCPVCRSLMFERSAGSAETGDGEREGSTVPLHNVGLARQQLQLQLQLL